MFQPTTQMMARAHSLVKLSDAQVHNIRRLVASGIRPARLAERYGVSRSYITMIVKGKARTESTDPD